MAPIVNRKLNFDKEMTEKDLIDWKNYLSTKRVSKYRSKIVKHVKNSSSIDPLLLQLCKIGLNLTKSNPYHHNYLVPATQSINNNNDNNNNNNAE